MLMRINEIADLFQCSSSVVTNCRRIIKDHQERYGAYSISGTLTNAACFLDAYTYRKNFAQGLPLPEYDELKAVQIIKEMMS